MFLWLIQTFRVKICDQGLEIQWRPIVVLQAPEADVL